MRIVGEIEHPRLKITVMHHGRYLLKLEDRDTEIVYRFRDGEGIDNLESARKVLDLGLLQEAEKTLMEMSQSRTRYLQPLAKDDEFPTIL